MDTISNFTSAVRWRLSPQGRGEQGSLPVVMIVLSFVLAITLALISALNLQMTKLRQEQNDIYRSVALDSGVAYAAQTLAGVQNGDPRDANWNLPTEWSSNVSDWQKAPDGEGYFRVKILMRDGFDSSSFEGFVVQAAGGDPKFDCRRISDGTYDCDDMVSDYTTLIYKYDPAKEYGKKKLVEENSKEIPWVLVSRKPYDYTQQYGEGTVPNHEE